MSDQKPQETSKPADSKKPKPVPAQKASQGFVVVKDEQKQWDP